MIEAPTSLRKIVSNGSSTGFEKLHHGGGGPLAVRGGGGISFFTGIKGRSPIPSVEEKRPGSEQLIKGANGFSPHKGGWKQRHTEILFGGGGLLQGRDAFLFGGGKKKTVHEFLSSAGGFSIALTGGGG